MIMNKRTSFSSQVLKATTAIAVIPHLASALQLSDESAWQDTTRPADNCVRIYRSTLYTIGGDDDWEDLCTEIGSMEEVLFDLQASHPILNFDNTIASFKTGLNTAVKFCTQTGETRCDEFIWGEAAGGGSESMDVGIQLSHTTVRLTPYDPTKRIAATTYARDRCNGHSDVIWIEEGFNSSGFNYADLGLLHLDQGVHSVRMPNGVDSWALFYTDTDFEGTSVEVSGAEGTGSTCRDLDFEDAWAWQQGGLREDVKSVILGVGDRHFDGIDESPVGERCCRLYRHVDFYMYWTHGQSVRDVCVDADSSWAGQIVSEAKSWRCGSHVYSQDSKMSAGGSASNSSTQIDDGTMLYLDAFDPELEQAMTVYSGKGCTQYSSKLQYEASSIPMTSAWFQNVGDHLEIGSDIRSVFLPSQGRLETVKFYTPEGDKNEHEITDHGEGGCYDLPAGVSGFVEHVEITYGSSS